MVIYSEMTIKTSLTFETAGWIQTKQKEVSIDTLTFQSIENIV